MIGKPGSIRPVAANDGTRHSPAVAPDKLTLRHCARAFLCLAAFAGLFPSIAGGEATAPPPPEAFGAVPHMTDVVLSPNGKMLAWILHDGTTSQVVMYDLAAQKAKRQLGADPVKPRRLIWVDDETVLIEVSTTLDTRDAGKHRYEVYRYLAAEIGRAHV